MAFRKWKPSKTAARDFAAKMDAVRDFCRENQISHSMSFDSFYFTVDGQKYRVSNHSIEASNAAAYDDLTGEMRRDLYHDDGRRADTRYIHAGKTRIIDIYNAIAAGHDVDGRGNII